MSNIINFNTPKTTTKFSPDYLYTLSDNLEGLAIRTKLDVFTAIALNGVVTGDPVNIHVLSLLDNLKMITEGLVLTDQATVMIKVLKDSQDTTQRTANIIIFDGSDEPVVTIASSLEANVPTEFNQVNPKSITTQLTPTGAILDSQVGLLASNIAKLSTLNNGHISVGIVGDQGILAATVPYSKDYYILNYLAITGTIKSTN